MEVVQDKVPFTATVDGRTYDYVLIERLKSTFRGTRSYSVKYQEVETKQFLFFKYTVAHDTVSLCISINEYDAGVTRVGYKYFYSIDLAKKMIKLAVKEFNDRLRREKDIQQKISELNVKSHI